MNLQRLLTIFASVALLSTCIACGEGGSGTSYYGIIDDTPSRVGAASIPPTATTSVGGTATTVDPIVLLTATGATVTIPGGTSLFSGGGVIPGTPKITANVASFIGALPPGASTAGLVTTNGNVTVRITITTDTGVNVDGFSAPGITVKMQTTMAPGSIFNYYSFNGFIWVLEGTTIVAGDGTVTFIVTHLSDWTSTGTLISSASGSVQTAQKTHVFTKTAADAPLTSTAATTSELKVTTKGATITIPAGTYLYSSNNNFGKSENTAVELRIFSGDPIAGQPPATLTATSYLTYIPSTLDVRGIDNPPPQDNKQVYNGVPAAMQSPMKPIAVLTIDFRAGSTQIKSINFGSSPFTIILKAAAPAGARYLCWMADGTTLMGSLAWYQFTGGNVSGDGTISIDFSRVHWNGSFPTAIVCKDSTLE